ncbi:MAG: DUF814 domain-containing protein [Candidatus Micrarchaeota archaeon]|nr:DUF814 domain-containing protein [Candidatus Micrarchaeota archaeon]
MEVELDLRKTARANLSAAYAQLRALKDKRAGLRTAMGQTQKELFQAEKEALSEAAGRTGPAHSKPGASPSKPGRKAKSKWSAQYLSFATSGGRLVVAGRSAKENDELYAKHLAPGDLFFHADIQGAPTVILKDGQKASDSEKRETAQWAASYSSAWKTGVAAVDVYALRPEQVSKTDSTGYAGKGAFFLSGEREWFRATPLSLKIGVKDGQPATLPACHPSKLDRQLILTPGAVEKESAARKLSAHLSAKADEISPLLPSGKFTLPL